MEDRLMDKELEEAESLTKDDLLAKLEHGRPAKLARPRNSNQRAKAVVDAVTERSEQPRGIAMWPEGEPQERIVLTRVELPPIRITGSRLRTRTEA